MRRVVITGAGIVSALGDDLETFFGHLKQGKHAFSHISHFDTDYVNAKIAAEIKGFECENYGISAREARKMDRYTVFGLAAANLAIEDAKTDFKDLDPFRVGVIVSTGIGGIETVITEEHKRQEKGNKWVSPLLIPMLIPNMLAGTVAIRHGFKGANYSVTTACATSAHSIGEAFRRVKHGYEDVMLAGGAENPIFELSVTGFDNMKTLSRSTDIDRASIPFDQERDGFVMAEGACVLVLEELSHAEARGAHIYAEICGYGATDDAYHVTSPDPDGTGAIRAMQDAIAEAGLSTSEIGYINAHGTSTAINDRTETSAIKGVFGEYAYKIPVSSTKSMTGHLLGAAGAAETLISALALEHGVIPPTIGLRVPDPDCDLDYVTEGAREQPIKATISNSLGFGGHNAAICLKKYIK